MLSNIDEVLLNYIIVEASNPLPSIQEVTDLELVTSIDLAHTYVAVETSCEVLDV